MKLGLTLFCLLTLVNVAAARAQDVTVDYDKRVDFSGFKTYSWAGGIPTRNPFIDQQIRERLEEQLAAKGLRRIEQGGDLDVLYLAAVDTNLTVSTSTWVTTGDWLRPIQSGISVKSQMWDVETGTLVVCLSDASNKGLLWRGVARIMLDKKSKKQNAYEALTEDAGKVEKKIRKGVAKMFEQYPLAKPARQGEKNFDD